MKKRLTLKRTALALACICATNLTAIAQIGIGTTMPNANAALEVSSTAAENKGLLLPKVALTGTVSVAPLSAHVAGMTVYNTATVADVTSGYYYNDGTKWIKMGDANGIDLRAVNTNSHVTKDAGVGSNGTDAGGDDVIAIGAGAGNNNIIDENIFIGSGAGNLSKDAQFNTFIGYNSGINNTEGGSNTAIGYLTLTGTDPLFGGDYQANTAVGSNALKINEGNGNTAIGASSMQFNTTGERNTAIGEASGFKITTGNQNTLLGNYTGTETTITTGSNNTILGFSTGQNITTGSSNTIIGAQVVLTTNVSNTIVIADGDGNQRLYIDNNGIADMNGKVRVKDLTGVDTDPSVNPDVIVTADDVTGELKGVTASTLISNNLTAGKLINITGNTISKINNINVVTVTASLTIDADSFTEGIFRCDMTTTNDFTLADFSNPSDGGVYSIHLIGANAGTVTFPGSFVREDGITALGTVNVAAGEMITFYHFGGTNYTMEQ